MRSRRAGAVVLVLIAAASVLLAGYLVVRGRYRGYGPLAAATALVFPLALAALLGEYVRRYRDHPEADTLLGATAVASVLGGADLLFIAYAVVTTQRTLGVEMARQDVFVSELTLGGVLFGVLIGHLFASTRIARRREVSQYRAFVESASDIISVVEPDGTIRYQSPAVEDVLGYTPGKLEGENGLDYIHPEDREQVFEALAEAVRNPDERVRTEYRFRDADGEWRWLASRSNNQLENPAIEGIVVDSHDISELKRRERELEETNQRLEEFASLVSHDLRNPLNVARGRLALARRTWRDGDPATVTEQFDAVDRALDRMERLIADLLTLARSGEEHLDPERVDVEAVCRRCTASAVADSLTVSVESDLEFRADRDRLTRLLENLLRNAAEHAGADADVTVGELEDGDGFYVVDDGEGIPKEDREQVFEHGYSTAEGGTGFGLAIVEQVADAHGWEVRVTESDAGGARFEFHGVETA